MLIDTQGLFDENSTARQNGNIFSLSTLMSSIQIFNFSQKMQENYLENLHVIFILIIFYVHELTDLFNILHYVLHMIKVVF